MTDERQLTAERVEEVFIDCLFRDGEDPSTMVGPIEGIMSTFGFHPERLAGHKQDIIGMLSELPDTFASTETGGGGGWSFLNACMNRWDEQWTGFHARMEQLFVLGMAIDRVKCQVPRALWEVMPGGMPYYVVDLVDLSDDDLSEDDADVS